MNQPQTLGMMKDGALALEQARQHIMNPEAAEHVPARHGHASRRGSTPPTAPKAMLEHRPRRATNRSLIHQVPHATEAQQYWTKYPTSQQSSSSGSFNSRGRTDSIITSSPDSTEPARRATQEHHQLLNFLRAHLARLQAQAPCVAETYRNFGLVFHCFPTHVIWDDAIHPDVRTFARSNFMVRDGYPLPEIIHVIGTLTHALNAAAGRLHQISVPDAEAQKACAELQLAERLVAEGMAKLELLRQAVEVFGRMRAILLMQWGKEWEAQKVYARRMRFYQAWAHALPMACWEGLCEEDRNGLDAARRAAMVL